MRVSPIGVWAAGDPARAARAAREDSALTHPNPVCLEACAAYAAAIAVGVAGASGREAMREAALAQLQRPRARGDRAAASRRTTTSPTWAGCWSRCRTRSFTCASSSFEEALIATVSAGGDTDTNAAICGALLGAALGRAAIPPRWILPVLACRSTVDAGAPRPRPAAYWPDDILELAEALLQRDEKLALFPGADRSRCRRPCRVSWISTATSASRASGELSVTERITLEVDDRQPHSVLRRELRAPVDGGRRDPQRPSRAVAARARRRRRAPAHRQARRRAAARAPHLPDRLPQPAPGALPRRPRRAALAPRPRPSASPPRSSCPSTRAARARSGPTPARTHRASCATAAPPSARCARSRRTRK